MEGVYRNIRSIPVTVRMIKRRHEIPPRQKVNEKRSPWRFILAGKIWRKKLLNISIDLFRSVSGIPVLKIDRQAAESQMRRKREFLTLMTSTLARQRG
jgi:hypothetical protein